MSRRLIRENQRYPLKKNYAYIYLDIITRSSRGNFQPLEAYRLRLPWRGL